MVALVHDVAKSDPVVDFAAAAFDAPAAEVLVPFAGHVGKKRCLK